MIQYSGGPIIHRTFTPTSRQNLTDNLTQAISDAGWATISGTPGSGADVIFESAAQNSGAKIRLRLATSSVRVAAQIKHPAGSTADGQPGYLQPSNSWRIIANPFQVFAFMQGGVNRMAHGGTFYAGTLYTPSFLAYTASDALGFSAGTSNSDVDSGARQSWRSRLRNPTGSAFAVISRTTICSSMNTTNINYASILCWQGGQSNVDSSYLWEDGSAPVIEPLVAVTWPTLDNQNQAIFGQLYDAVLVQGVYVGETTFQLDGHTWMFLSDGVDGGTGSTGCLALAIT